MMFIVNCFYGDPDQEYMVGPFNREEGAQMWMDQNMEGSDSELCVVFRLQSPTNTP